MSRWPLHNPHFWEKAPFFRILLPLVAGILLYTYTPHSIPLSLVTILVATSIVIYCLVAFQKTVKPLLVFIPFHLAIIGFGWLLSCTADVCNNNNWFGHQINNGKGYVAAITGIPQDKGKIWKLAVNIIATKTENGFVPATGNAIVYVDKGYAPFNYNTGDTVLLPANWQPIKNAGNPAEFDYATYCARNNIYYYQFTDEDKIHLFVKASPKDNSYPQQVHVWCMQQLYKYLPDTTTKGLIQAMLLGDETNLDPNLKTAYAQTGIVHIIAISGGNVAVFFALIAVLLWWLKDKKYQWIKYLLALPLVWFYILMAGAPPSAVRAAVMFSLLAFGIMLQKNNNSLNQLFATAFILLCAQPMWLFAVGFQLSFVAVLSLILFYKPVYKWLSPVHNVTKMLWGTIAASIAAEILVAPLVIYYFHLFPLLFVVANALAFIFMGVVLILGMLIIALSFVPPIATFIAIIATWLCTFFNSLVAYLQHLNPVSFSYLTVSGTELLLLYLAIAALSIYFLLNKKNCLFTALISICMALLFFCTDEWRHLRQHKLVVYNISKTVYTEAIIGKQYSVLINDSIHIHQPKGYTLTPAHTQWQAYDSVAHNSNEVFSIGGKTILLLNRPFNTSARFPVDYIVINCLLSDMPPQHIQHIFSPKCIVLGNYGYNKNQLQKWVQLCDRLHIQVYNVADSGAFILNAF